MSPRPDCSENEFTEALAGLSVLDDIPSEAHTAVDRRKQQWEKNCTNYTILLEDWHSRKISRQGLREYPNQLPGPRSFHISKSIVSNVYTELVAEIPGLVRLKECSRSEYARSMKQLLEVEEVYQTLEMRKYDRAVQLDIGWLDKFAVHASYCRIQLKNLPNWSPSLVPTDFVFLYNRTKSSAVATRIKSIKGDHIYLPNDRMTLFSLKVLAEPLSAAFVSSGTPFRYCQMAIRELGVKTSLRSIVFEDAEPENKAKINVERTNRDFLVEKLNELNESQRDAVIGILKAECRPKPYILFGPPGTGKSHTLVAAVVQVYYRSFTKYAHLSSHRSCLDDYSDLSSHSDDDNELDLVSGIGGKRAKILITINSNACTDDLYHKIKKELPSAKILRLSAGDYPPRESDFDIIVTTNIKSGCLYEQEFDYVFVDEAGHANEAESLVPLCKLKWNGCLVLAGDPKQLGPVVMCRQAGDLGLETSLLERLFEFGIYRRDATTNKYDKRYITMLQECYRCDERILAPCNRLFYESDLVCRNSTPTGVLKLLQLTGPIQSTKRVHGKEERPEYSTSWRNLSEADFCVDLVIRLFKMGIEPEQIGVTTPYKLQQKEILKKLKISLRFYSAHLSQRFLLHKYIEKKWTEDQKLVLQSEDNNAKRLLYESLKSTFYKKVDDQYFKYVPSAYDGPVQLYEKIVSNNNWQCKVDSIDAFQGNEKEIMIISTVRTDPNIHRLEFLNDARRFNVAVSRAKWLVFIIGSPYVLELGKYWPEVMKDSKNDIDEWPLHVHDLSNFTQKPLFRTR